MAAYVNGDKIGENNKVYLSFEGEKAVDTVKCPVMLFVVVVLQADLAGEDRVTL